MLTKGVVTPIEVLSTQKRLKEELKGFGRYMKADSCIAQKDFIVLLAKCIEMKRRELSILRMVLMERN